MSFRQVWFRSQLVASCALLLPLAACSDEAADGTVGGACYGNGTCNEGLTCASNLCVMLPDVGTPDGGTPDSGATDAGPPDVAIDVMPDADANDAPSDAGHDAFVPADYPPGPYGNEMPMEGDIIADHAFNGYADPDFLCRENASHVQDVTTPQPITFEDFFTGNSACASERKLLLVTIGTGWCGPCRAFARAIQAEFAGGGLPNEVSVLYVLYEGDTAGVPASLLDVQNWIDDRDLTYPVVMGDAFFQTGYLPTSALIRTDTMEIIEVFTGSGTEGRIVDAATDFLRENP